MRDRDQLVDVNLLTSWNHFSLLVVFRMSQSFVLLTIFFSSFLHVDSQNSSYDEFLPVIHPSLTTTWTNQQFIVCFVSVILGTLLFFITFLVPALIIFRRTRREKNRFDLRELRRMSDFM